MVPRPENAPQTSSDDARPAPTVWPTLLAHDAPALIDFLVDTVGFERTAVYEDGGKVAHAQLDWPEGGGIMLGSYDPEKKGPWTLEPGTLGAYVVTDHVDELYERLTAPGSGVQILMEIVDQPYGNREFAITDPEGNKWSFGPYRGEPRR
ncbi:VOC family protein [Streptomyces sp. B-S-A8]|uniref:VOC family protein n=1 Tax=Streptomyces solicavernae TaxID=3043614 RepID=A0ABT6RL00_9ACTN|nr:VOC family protein [Streptomyces sp. B-S-A8]MDI3385102.1 VOC family protein [Streptomyces sp. B-S-A8]